MISVGVELVDQWPVLGAVIYGEPGGLSDSQDIHAIHLDTRDIVSSLVELGRGSVSAGLKNIVVHLSMQVTCSSPLSPLRIGCSRRQTRWGDPRAWRG